MKRLILVLTVCSYITGCTTGAENQTTEAPDQAQALDAKDNEKRYFIDVHELGPGNVTDAAVAEAHEKDLAVQGEYDVNFINYWVNEEKGTVMCLSEAHNKDAVIKTHRKAHGLIPASVADVTQGE